MDLMSSCPLHSVFVDEILTSCQDRVSAFAKINESISLKTQELSKAVWIKVHLDDWFILSIDN